MADIKTRDTSKGTIKAINKAAVATERMKKAYVMTKDKAEHSAKEYASDKIEAATDRAVHETAYRADKVGRWAVRETRQNYQKSSKILNTKKQIDEFMEIGGWKARRSGRELSIASSFCTDSFEKGVFRIKAQRKTSDWREWIKTIGQVIYRTENEIEIVFKDKSYIGEFTDNDRELEFTFNIGSNTKTDIDFMSAFKIIMRKTAYCVFCRVCESNCPHGFIKMNYGKVKIDDRCVKCRKCHKIFYGCLLANSMRLPKGEGKMGSVNRYGNMGVEYEWLTQYFEAIDGGYDFWTSSHSLGTNKVKYLKCFLQDSGITIKNKGQKEPLLTRFGEIIADIGIDSSLAWGLIACNWAYSSQFGWWIKNIDLNTSYSPEAIYAMLDDTISENVRGHIVSALYLFQLSH